MEIITFTDKTNGIIVSADEKYVTKDDPQRAITYSYDPDSGNGTITENYGTEFERTTKFTITIGLIGDTGLTTGQTNDSGGEGFVGFLGGRTYYKYL